MQIIIDEIDRLYYADIVLSPSELKRLGQAELLTQEIIYKRKKCYIGLRLQGAWDYDEPNK
jgi:hypothetical protein